MNDLARSFAEWQPKYAEHGIATFPVKNKLPCIRGWQRVGLDGSAQLALKFAEAEAFGFTLGKRSGITIGDVDLPSEVALLAGLEWWGDTRRQNRFRLPLLLPTQRREQAGPVSWSGKAIR